MIEVFRRRKRLYLVFEYLDHTVLDELEEAEGGLDWERSRRHIFQILRGLDFCHHHKVSEITRSRIMLELFLEISSLKQRYAKLICTYLIIGLSFNK